MDDEIGNETQRPTRKPMNHRGPFSVDVSEAVYFITIAAAERGSSVLTDKAATILDAARFYQSAGKWMLHLFLIMPDHIHMLVHVSPDMPLADVIGHWKVYLTTRYKIQFQKNFFDTRIRDEEHFAEKWKYICRNPVVRGLVDSPRKWPHVIAFDPESGVEREHR